MSCREKVKLVETTYDLCKAECEAVNRLERDSDQINQKLRGKYKNLNYKNKIKNHKPSL